MGIIETVGGTVIGISLVNGKIKPKYVISNIIGCIIVFLLDILFAFLLIFYGIINFDLEFIFFPVLGIVVCTYFLLIIPVLQNPNNFYIKFKDYKTLEGFELYYKNKKVNVLYKLDGRGRIMFNTNIKKKDCISYADGSKMSNVLKFKIINYFSMWLKSNNLLSEHVTLSIE